MYSLCVIMLFMGKRLLRWCFVLLETFIDVYNNRIDAFSVACSLSVLCLMCLDCYLHSTYIVPIIQLTEIHSAHLK